MKNSIQLLFGLALSASTVSAINLQLNYDPTSVFTADDYAVFETAEAFWESQLIGYLDGGTRTVNVAVKLFSEGWNAGSITLGYANPLAVVNMNYNSKTYKVTNRGEMVFNNHPDALAVGGYDIEVVIHEMGHLLGFGTLWTHNNLYVDGTGEYTGSEALATYRNEFNLPLATFVPVELDFGAGTADGHWNESPNVIGDPHVSDQSPAPTANGESLNDEILSGKKSGSLWMSETTLAQFRDLGYNTVPEASTLTLGAVAALGLLRRRRA